MVVCRSRELMCLGMGFTLSLVMSYVQFFDQGLDLISRNRQIGNDVPIYIFKELMQKKRKIGTFVEFGCADGIKHSNSYAFEQMGWSGLCIEPNYPNYLKAKQVRKNAIFALVTGKPGKFTYYNSLTHKEGLNAIREAVLLSSTRLSILRS